MGQGYIRNDLSNDISNNNVVDADDLDGEFDALVAAFAAATGHSHDGTAAEGGVITVVGPAQEYVSDGTAFFPKGDDTYDLGKPTAEWKDLYIDGTAYLDTASIDAMTVVNTATFAGATIADLGSVTTAELLGGTIDSMPIGLGAPSSGDFTTLNASSLVLATDLPITEGGTGSSSAVGARSNLGVTIGLDVQAYSAVLDGTTASYTTAEETKLAGIETAATADQTGAEIKVAYEAELDTNAFTDALLTKLNAVEALADVTDTANVTAAGALMDSELTNIAAVKALNQGIATTDSPTFAGLTATTADINGGTVDGSIVGGSVAAAGSFTTLNASGALTADLSTISSTGDLAVADGGTGASTAAAARTNLDVDQAGTALALAIALG